MASFQHRNRTAAFGNIEARSTYRLRPRRAQNGVLALVKFMRPVRIATVLVSLLAIAVPSRPSAACFSRTEARHHFLTSYLYSHGLDGCWDAMARPSIRHAARKNDPSRSQPVREVSPGREAVQPAAAVPPENGPELNSPQIAALRTAAPQDPPAVAPVTVPEAEVVQVTPAPIEQAIEHEPEPTTTTASVEQSAPLPVIGRSAEPTDRPRDTIVASLSVIGMALAAALALGIMQSKFRRSYARRVLRFSAISREHEPPSSREHLDGRSSPAPG